MKYRVCWKERETGKVLRDEYYTNIHRTEEIRDEMAGANAHFYWIEDETGAYVSSDEPKPQRAELLV